MQVTISQLKEWHEEGVELASGYVRAEARMVELLSLVAGANGYYYFKCESLRSYAIFKWKLPESAARDMVTVACKALEIPALLTTLKRGKTSVSKLRRICAVITIEDQAEWLDVAERCSFHEILKLIAAARPEKAIQEGFYYRAEDVLEMRAAVSEDLSKDLLYVQDLLSQKFGRAATLGEVLSYMANLALEKLDPVRRAERAEKRAAAQEECGSLRVTKWSRQEKPVTEGGSESAEESSLKAGKQEKTGKHEKPGKQKKTWQRARKKDALTHKINLRDLGQCTHIDENGQRCPNRRWLHVHHVEPVSEGGTDTLENLQTLCSQHHRLLHYQQGLTSHH